MTEWASRFPECGNVDYAGGERPNQDPTLPFEGILFFGDGVTSECNETSPGQVCLWGEAGSSVQGDNMYQNWGAGMG